MAFGRLGGLAIAARGRALYALDQPTFRRLWAAALLDAFGTWMERLSVGWFVLASTGSVFLAALSFAVRNAPNMVFGPFGGAIADRFDRPSVLRVTATVRAALLVGVGWVVLAGVHSPWPILLLVAMSGIARACEMPATQATIADIVGVSRAAGAVGLHTFGVRLAGVIGSFVAGFLLDLVGPGAVFLIAAAAVGLAALVYSTLRVPRGTAAMRVTQSLWRDAIEGLRTVLRIPVVLALLLLAVGIEIFAFSYQSLLPAVADRVLHVGAPGLGTLTLAAGLGGIAGMAALSLLGDAGRKGPLLLGVTLMFGASLIAFAWSDHFALSLALIGFAGAMAAMFDALQWVLLQASVPDEVRGRVIGTWMAAIGFGWLGPIALGALAQGAGVQTGVAVGGAIALALGAGAAGVTSLRRL